MKSLIKKDNCVPIFTAALFTIAKTWKQPKCPPTDEWIKKLCAHTMEYYSAIKKKTLAFATTWMDLEDNMVSERSQTEKGKHSMIPLICGIHQIKDRQQNQTHNKRDQICGCQR